MEQWQAPTRSRAFRAVMRTAPQRQRPIRFVVFGSRRYLNVFHMIVKKLGALMMINLYIIWRIDKNDG